MKQTKSQKRFKKEMKTARKKKISSKSNIHYVGKLTYDDRINDYKRKWFRYFALPKWLPILLLLAIGLYLLVSVL